jgi:hypothetical protein
VLVRPGIEPRPPAQQTDAQPTIKVFDRHDFHHFFAQIKDDDLMDQATVFLVDRNKETKWRTDTLDAEELTNKGFLDGTEPGF